MKRKGRGLFLIILGLFLFSGSALAGKISDLETEVIALKNRINELEEREERFYKAVEELKAENQDLRKQLADLRAESGSLLQQLGQIQALVRELNDRIAKLEAPLASGLAKPTMQEGDTTSGDAQAPSNKPGGNSPPSAQSLKEIYELGLNYFKEGKYDSSRAQFEAFIKASADDPYAGNARFWIGECYYQEKDYKRAILEYDRVQKEYPNSTKVPPALYKMGICFEHLGKKTEAGAVYKDLISRFPKSEEANKAKVQLDKLQNVPEKK